MFVTVNSPRPSGDFSRYRLLLSGWALMLGLAAIGSALYVTVRCYIGVPFEDEWTTIEDLGNHNGTYSLPLLWALHNEHRMPFTKLFEMADLYWFRGKNISLYVEIYTLQTIHLFAFWLSMGRIARWPPWLTAVGTGLAAFALFWIAQHQSFNPLGMGILPAFVFGTLSTIALMFALRNPERPYMFLAGSIASAFVSEASLANGLLVWPLLLAMAARFRLRMTLILPMAVIGALSIGLYLVNYVRPDHHANPSASLHKPVVLVQYLLIYFGNLWAGVSHNLATVMAAAGLIAAPFCYAVEMVRPNPRIFRVGILTICMFLAGTGCLTALGRINFPLVQAASSRYQTTALLFWLCLALYALDVANRDRMRAVVITAAAALSLTTLILSSASSSLSEAIDTKNRVIAGSLPIFADVKDDVEIKKLAVPPDLVFDQRQFLRDHNTAFYDGRPFELLGKSLAATFQIASPTRCLGAVERERRIADRIFPGWELFGWVWDREAKRPVESMIAVTDGRISGIGISGLARPDVRRVVREVSNPQIGWRVYVQGSDSVSPVAVYGIVDDGKSVCLAMPAFSLPTKQPR